MRFSFGEREGGRSWGATGGYVVRLDYTVEIDREIPNWVRDEADFRFMGSLPCFQPRIFTGPQSLAALGILPNEGFPFCFPGDIERGRIGLTHPLGVALPPPSVQPSPAELFAIRWPNIDAPFDVTITSPPDLFFAVLDTHRKTIGEATPTGQERLTSTRVVNGSENLIEEGQASGRQLIAKRLKIPQLDEGLYFFRVSGAPHAYAIGFTPPVVDSLLLRDQRQRHHWYRNWSVWIVLAAVVSMLVVVFVFNTRRT